MTAHRRAFTLVEVVIAAGILAVLALAAHSAIMLSLRAVETTTESRLAREVELALAIMREELAEAVELQALSSNEVIMLVPDRDANGVPETIRYMWAGQRGAPIQRQLNGGAITTVLADVGSFALTPVTEMRSDPPTFVEGAECLLGGSAATTLATFAPVGTLAYGALVLEPPLPRTTSAWRVTRVRFVGKRLTSLAAALTVDLRPASGWVPTTPLLASASVPWASVPRGAGWIDVAFPDVAMPTGCSQAAIVIQGGSLIPSAGVEVGARPGGPTWDAWMTGVYGAFVPVPTTDLTYEVFGRVTTPEYGAERECVAALGLSVTLTGASTGASDAIVVLLNRPYRP